ncbi:hypothetical protein WAF00_03055 [Mameliella alba]|uniref:hypothetical protein n=1 Tax=Mameliella alba TaxID=561184 RepID=UPI0030131E47
MIPDDEIAKLMQFIHHLNETPAEPTDVAAKRFAAHREAMSFDFISFADRPRSELDAALKQHAKKVEAENARNPLRNLDFSKEARRIRKQNFPENLQLCIAMFERYQRTGERPAPAYPTRVEVLLRKAKRRDLFEQFNAAWDRHFGYDTPSPTDDD